MGTVAVGAGKMNVEGCGCFVVYESSLSSAEVCDRLCVTLSVLGERNDISGRIPFLHLREGTGGGGVRRSVQEHR
jgi:hypothetical protein